MTAPIDPPDPQTAAVEITAAAMPTPRSVFGRAALDAGSRTYVSAGQWRLEVTAEQIDAGLAAVAALRDPHVAAVELLGAVPLLACHRDAEVLIRLAAELEANRG